LTRAHGTRMLRHRAIRARNRKGVTKTQMSHFNLACTAAFGPRMVAPVGVAARGRSVPFLT